MDYVAEHLENLDTLRLQHSGVQSPFRVGAQLSQQLHGVNRGVFSHRAAGWQLPRELRVLAITLVDYLALELFNGVEHLFP